METYAGQANTVGLAVAARATAAPITSGTVNFYLRAKDGENAEKWYKGGDESWDAAAQIAGAATHVADGHWDLSLPSAVWTAGVRYRLYGKEDGDLHIPTGVDVLCSAVKGQTDKIGATAWTVSSPVSQDGTAEIVRGDDWPEGNEYTFTKTGYSGPSLASAGVQLLLQLKSLYDVGAGAVAHAIDGSLAVNGTTITCTFVLTAAQTAELGGVPPAARYNYVYQVLAATTGGKKITLALGAWNVLRNVAAI